MKRQETGDRIATSSRSEGERKRKKPREVDANSRADLLGMKLAKTPGSPRETAKLQFIRCCEGTIFP
jgi:hypothetical protein